MCLALSEDVEGIKTVLKAAVIQVLGLRFHSWKMMTLLNTTANLDCLGFYI